MRIGILGAGAIACGMAAFLAKAGHQPILWSPSGALRKLAEGACLTATGAVEFSGSVAAASDCAEAVVGADAIIVALPANGHRLVFDAAVPHLKSGQPVIISSHSSFGALYLSKRLADRGIRLPIIVWGTTLLTGRQQSDGVSVSVNTIRQKIDVATLPKSAAVDGKALCTELFGERFVERDGLLAIALSNLNPQNHLGIALLNLTRMEKGERWGQGEYVTPAVGQLIEALDLERLRIAESFGLSVRTVREHFSLSFHVPMSSVSEMNQQMHREGRGGFGPATADSRYIYEDVPFGLVPTSLLGRIAGSPALLHEAGTSLFSAAMGRNLVADNDLLPDLALDELSPTALTALCEEWPTA
ncbi:NAD/NADP-dependent octopine/nopaline dehydrogenase family protein [Sinorhizobium mexicanum]|uniref:NAD/NADP octopine/nopaline dehydrogenase n=1 Tax=Sinorhizobium mexicanum TaxID=375549 RepID=A0A859R4Y7_9HYPH|nr:NAD/NADP-dependent octopine/nopaline dehydrogenase family protein [Sinorhizobium mexicanum]MBP1883898.1 opine dehydrogenase [Sinorhizobium mexicanum]QLL64638.1 NAD/NADP octopine/nopaline dehydrogenase [Sinorhizobium mexicanum]